MSIQNEKLWRGFNPLKKRFVWLNNELTSVITKQTNEVCDSICATIRNATAYSVLSDLNIAHKEQTLLMFYPVWNNKTKVMVANNFDIMQKYLNATRPVRVSNLVRVGGANDGGYVMINPKIDLLRDINVESTHDFPPPKS